MKSCKKILLSVTIIASGLAAPCAQAAITFTEVHGFINYDSVNGYNSQAALVQFSNGNLYGTTCSGGANNEGTIFGATTNGSAFGTLASFTLLNGGYLGGGYIAGPIQGTDGYLYGTTQNGGANLAGEVYQLTGLGINVLYSFTGGNDGSQPYAGLVQGTDGNFYGTTTVGGLFTYLDPNNIGYGTVFQITPAGSLTTLHSFSGSDGFDPLGNLVQGKDGSLYGTTLHGGLFGFGTVFKISTTGIFSTLYSFTGGTDGGLPLAGLVQGVDNNFYGTTYYYGAYNSSDPSGYGNGTVFKITANGLLTTLASFNNTNGANPNSTLVQGGDGNFYGTTYNGLYNGSVVPGLVSYYPNFGSIVQITPAGVITNLVSFDSSDGYGAYPNGLIQGKDGGFYGTCRNGGTDFGASGGIIFRLGVPGAALVAPPVFQTINKSNNLLTFTWSAASGKTYQLQFKTNLFQPNWQNIGGVITASGLTASTTDSIGPGKQRFYRVGLLP